jgi:hypothetical protein
VPKMKLEALNPFQTIKEGDTNSVFRFRLLDHDSRPVDLTNKRVTVVVGNVFGKIMEKEISIDDTHEGTVYFRFEETDWGGFYGSVGLEIHVQDLTTQGVSIFPSADYYRFRVERSLDTNGKEYVTVALEEVRHRLDVVETSLISTVKSINGTAPDPSGNVEVDVSTNVDTTNLATKAELDGHAGNLETHVTPEEKTSWTNKSDFTGNYNDLTGKPSIPTATSQLTNDTGFITSAEIPPGTDTSALETRVGDAETTLTAHGTRITTLENAPAGEIYDDTAIRSDITTLQTGKSDVTHTHPEYQLAGDYSTIDHSHPELHTHPNQTVIDDLGDTEGKLTYKGAEIGGGTGSTHEHSNFNVLETFSKNENEDLFTTKKETIDLLKAIITTNIDDGTNTAANILDDNFASYWSSGTNTGELRITFDNPIVINTYFLYQYMGNTSTAHPLTWNFEGSNDDGVTWDIVDSIINYAWTNSANWDDFVVSNPGKYKDYRLNILQTKGGVALRVHGFKMEGQSPYQMAMKSDLLKYEHNNISTLEKLSENESGNLTLLKSSNVDLTPEMTANSLNGFTVNQSRYSYSYYGRNLFDNKTASYWTSYSDTDGWVQITMDQPRHVIKYRIYSQLDEGNKKHIRNWNFEGSNDGGATWDVLHSVLDHTWDTVETWHDFDLDSHADYLDYRLNVITADAGFRVYEMELIEGVFEEVGKVDIEGKTFVNVGLTIDQPVTVLNTGVNVVFDNVIDDHLGEYNPATGEFTAKEDGIYQINISLSYNSFTENGRSRIYMFKNNATYKKMVDNFILAYMPFGSVASPIEKLQAGDVIRFAYNIQRESTLLSDPIQTYLTITKID